MNHKFLYQELEILDKYESISELPEIIERNLSDNILLREYQEKAFQYFVTYFENEKLRKNKQVHTLFHMATGSGKTVIMAGLILYLYTKGYRKFLFFVNQTNILEKTKENFTNNLSSKYLFNDEMNYLGNKIHIKQVEKFSKDVLAEDIEIIFTTTQKLHMDLFAPKENIITYKDFEDDEIVFISDESHHANSFTKKPTKDEDDAAKSWEYSVTNAFLANKDSVMLEFTATCDLKDKNVTAKYLDKIVFNYPLMDFRESGYTKDFQNFATDTELWDRALIAMIVSEYRKFLFADLKLNIKPVVMFKSQKIKESEGFYETFFRKLKELTSYELKALYSANISLLSIALKYFEGKDETFEILEHSLKNSFSEEMTIIMNGASDNNTENQLKVNSLEDKDNPIRAIFAVDMLNEGWDVLNLFDIVRLYDTRQGSGKAGKVGAYTIKEAQLIGRGARYCPFVYDETELKYKRKFDSDINNQYRVLETMFFHSRNDSRYIAELRQALIATGLEAPDPITLEYKLKEEFKDSDFYKKAWVYSNERLPRGRGEIDTIEPSMKNKNYRYTQRSVSGGVVNLFGEVSYSTQDGVFGYKLKKFKEIDYNILSGACRCFNELRFNVIKDKYPHVKSLREFLTSEDYLGNSTIEITMTSDRLSGRDLFEACKRAFTKVASHILSLKQEFAGSTNFKPQQLSSVLKDKKIYLSSVVGDGGKGDSQNNCVNEAYRLNLGNENWYVFNDNYGTSEEKLFLKYFKTNIEPKLKAKNLVYYVVRNERIPSLAIYSFEAGERFEPDFLLFVRKKNIDGNITYQGYVEPKGGHLLEEDAWKEQFSLQIEDKYTIGDLFTESYKIIGFPFFNQENRMSEFEAAVDKFISKL